ncbi:MAG TPA: glycoside hydrolase family 31 protein [Draconibacterium sp.]|nr:glycoside hydrolase family 31 protein [Draconibacterium sp.]
MKKEFQTIIMFLITIQLFAQPGDTVKLVIEKGEYWWGGVSSLGHTTPYDATTVVSYDLWGDCKGNQAQPLLLSNKGRYIWSEEPIQYTFNNGNLTVTTRNGIIENGKAGENLKDAYTFVSQKFFPSNGKIPAELFFTNPQYNTWIELMYDQNEKDILKYAQNIIDNGFPPGILMIDDNWQEDYGTWDFSPRRFTDPKGMIKKLHEMGFQIMLWVCPFISPDSEVFRYLAREGMLILEDQKTQKIVWENTADKAAIIRWWNGASACLDLSNPKTQKWFKEKLDYLINEFGVDGYKFDAGDAEFYTNQVVSFKPGNPNDQTSYFAEFGLQYPLNEYRASWKMAGLPLVQRLRDKGHTWEDLQKLIPDLMSQSVMGYAYTCPDLIGGGEFGSFLSSATIDEELVVRSAQIHALMPMMQFSVAPWRVLSNDNEAICLEMAKLHKKMGPFILELAKNASVTGEPIVKPLAYVFPDGGFEMVKDQFMLGNDILVAPVVQKGARSRTVVLPAGNWKSDDGKLIKGGKTIEISVPLKRLPYFTLQH